MHRLRIALAVLVTGVWVAGYVVAFLTRGSDPTELSGLMAVVLGWAFAGEVRDQIKRRVGRGTGD